MFSEKALFDTQTDLAKITSAETLGHIANIARKGGELMSNKWVLSTVATLVGFVVHGLLVSQMVKPTTGNVNVDAGLADVVKVGTVLTVANAINTGMNGRVQFSEEWMKSTAITVAAFFAFHVLVADFVPVVEGRQALVMDVAKVSFTSVAIQLLSGKQLDVDYLISVAGTLSGFVVFHELIHPRFFK